MIEESSKHVSTRSAVYLRFFNVRLVSRSREIFPLIFYEDDRIERGHRGRLPDEALLREKIGIRSMSKHKV